MFLGSGSTIRHIVVANGIVDGSLDPQADSGEATECDVTAAVPCRSHPSRGEYAAI